MRGAAIDFLFVSAGVFPLQFGARRRTRGEGRGENTHVLAPCRNHAELSCRCVLGESLKGVAGGNRSFPPMPLLQSGVHKARVPAPSAAFTIQLDSKCRPTFPTGKFGHRFATGRSRRRRVPPHKSSGGRLTHPQVWEGAKHSGHKISIAKTENNYIIII